MAPVWEYALATEPLSEAQVASIGWAGRQGLSGVENFFHYYRLTSDNRIMIGGGTPGYFGNDPTPFVAQDEPARFEAVASFIHSSFGLPARLVFFIIQAGNGRTVGIYKVPENNFTPTLIQL